VAALLTRGRPNRRIAEEFSISERTVGKHVSNILKKRNFCFQQQVAYGITERWQRPPLERPMPTTPRLVDGLRTGYRVPMRAKRNVIPSNRGLVVVCSG
jgi:hypothetical protein